MKKVVIVTLSFLFTVILMGAVHTWKICSLWQSSSHEKQAPKQIGIS